MRAPTDYKAVAAGQVDSNLGAMVGTLLERLIISVSVALTSTVEIKDGNGAAIPILAANTPLGVYHVTLGIRNKNATTPGWKVTTGAGASVIAVGRFVNP